MKLLTLIRNWLARKLGYCGTGTTTTTTVEPETNTSETGETSETVTKETTLEPSGIVSVDTSIISNPTVQTRLVVLLDNGHASTTPGKRSPDGQLMEYEFNRDVVSRISNKLNKLGIRYFILVPEVDVDVALSKRADRANQYCDEYGKDNCLFISVHVNAAGNGTEWMNARGFSVWTTKGKTKSDEYADIFWDEMNKILPPLDMTMRKDTSDGDKDYESNFTVIYKTKCPALLTENLFMDNKIDKRFLMTNEGREAIADGHVNAIMRIATMLN